MNKIKDILHEKRKTTEDHIRQLQQVGKQGIRYTAMMPDIPFLVLGLLSDIGWIMHLTAGIIYLNKIHEKEIATKRQKDLGFGMTVYSGAAGAVIGISQIVMYAGVSLELVWIVIGGSLNFAAGLPIYLSFKKGIFYGVK